MEPVKFDNFVVDFVEENKAIHPTDPKCGRTFPEPYREASMLAFDLSCTRSFGEHCELLAFRCPAPHNCIRFCEYDYYLNEIREVYELPIEPRKLETVYDLQLARASEEDLSYVVFLDFGEHKEMFFLTFERKDPRPSMARNHSVYTVKGRLYGKINLLSPKFGSAYSVHGSTLRTKVGQQFRMASQLKYSGGREFIDGVSLFFDQARVDIDYRYFQNGTGEQLLKSVYGNQTHLFEYEFAKCRLIKANCASPTSYADPELTLVKLRFRPEYLEQTDYKAKLTERQKLKLLEYFIETIEKHSLPDYGSLRCLNPEPSQLEALSCLLKPRYELFGANYFTFLLAESH